MKKGLLILLPGIRYSVDCPLLYYTRIAYTYAGYEVIPVDDYGVKTQRIWTYSLTRLLKILSSVLKTSIFQTTSMSFLQKNLSAPSSE